MSESGELQRFNRELWTRLLEDGRAEETFREFRNGRTNGTVGRPGADPDAPTQDGDGGGSQSNGMVRHVAGTFGQLDDPADILDGLKELLRGRDSIRPLNPDLPAAAETVLLEVMALAQAGLGYHLARR